MHASEARALGELGGQLAAGVAGWAEGLHQAAVSRVVPGPGGVGGRARTVHDAVVGRTYGAARALGGVVGAAFGAVLAPLASGSPLSGSPTGGQVVSTLNAVVGDRLYAQGSPLALAMTLRGDGNDIDPVRADLETAFPDATGRLVLFVHGLAETDLAWLGRDGDGRPWSYAHALQPRGWTGAAVRYNTGRHIADSGESLGSLLEAVVAAWPVPVTDLALVGHSMGGLVIRAACASSVAAGHVWPALVRCCVYLGSPHHGAVLEQGADVVGRVLGDIAQAGLWPRCCACDRRASRTFATAGSPPTTTPRATTPMPASPFCLPPATTLSLRTSAHPKTTRWRRSSATWWCDRTARSVWAKGVARPSISPSERCFRAPTTSPC